MSNRHFEATMTRGAERDKISHDVRGVLVNVITAGVDVVNVEVTPAWTLRCAARLTHLVALTDSAADARPEAPFLAASAAAPMRAILGGHVLAGAIGRTEAPPSFEGRGEGREIDAALIASCNGVLAGGDVLANLTAKLIVGVTELNAADGASGNASISQAVGGVALPRTEHKVGAGAVGLALKGALTVGAGKALDFADRVYSALARTVVDAVLIGLKGLLTLEARLEHY